MGDRIPEVDAYIENAAPFAQPILVELREAFHEGCPKIAERIKWGVPSFEYRGMLGGMSAFEKHVGFGFWKGTLLDDPTGFLDAAKQSSPMAKKLYDVADLPPRTVLTDLVRQAARFNEEGKQAPKADSSCRPVVPDEPPEWFLERIDAVPAARATWDGFAPSYRRDYIEWVTTAKRETTREKRVAQAVEWMAEGKKRNWKYEK